MKKRVLSICILTGSLFFSPIQLSEAHVLSFTHDENVKNHLESLTDRTNVSAINTKVLSATSSAAGKVSHPDIDTLKEMADPKRTKDELASIFGEPTEVLRGAMDNNLLWRYDFKNNEDYEFTHDFDAVDVDALKADDLKYIVYIGFQHDEQSVNDIAIYYIDQDGKFHEYREYADGYVKDLVEGS
ncbi:hypothetical protein [Cytobacillus gottheilii]|uniref:hypothetical protein n=1 Tax=Cytobacillus gottheilii TaxID=859144 RepID=UPI0009BA6B4B|nr:hypothetical protein [Cytobacillus gottheilii]